MRLGLQHLMHGILLLCTQVSTLITNCICLAHSVIFVSCFSIIVAQKNCLLFTVKFESIRVNFKNAFVSNTHRSVFKYKIGF